MDKINVFKSVLDGFETEHIRKYCEDMINMIDDNMFVIPSSTSYKYHNKTQCQPGGQSYHVIMVGTIMNYILGLDYVKNKVDDEERRDCLRTAALLHDAKKTNGGKFTVHEHPIIAQKWIEDTIVEHDINKHLKEHIGRLVASHSGQWTTTKRSKTVLPSLENDEQFLVHLCDYLGSRANLDMIYENHIEVEPEEKIEDYIMPFGKYKGLHITEVPEDYLNWMNNNMDLNGSLKKFVNDLLN